MMVNGIPLFLEMCMTFDHPDCDAHDPHLIINIYLFSIK